MIQEINAGDFEKSVLREKGFVVVDFYSTECPPCEALHPKFEALAEQYADSVKFYRIFRQANRELAGSLGVKGSPALLFYRDGAESAPRLSGAIKKSAIKKTIVENFGLQDRSIGLQRNILEYELVIIGAGPAGLTSALYEIGRAHV
jgi:thioredoxin reductase (NADPH)